MLSQVVSETKEDVLLIVRFNIAVLSHPKTLVPVHVYIPDDVYVFPFQLILSQVDIFIIEEDELLIVRFKTAVLSQPTEFVLVQV